MITHPKLDFDESSGRYTLRLDALDENIYADTNTAVAALKRQSRLLYTWIYRCINPTNRRVVDQLLREDPGYVAAIAEALTEFAAADQLSGCTENIYQLDLQSGDALIKTVPQTVQEIMRTAASDKNIFYAGVLDRLGLL